MARLNSIVRGASKLSLGISIVVAIAIGVGLGLWLKDISGQAWTLWLGVFLGICAAILNVYKEYAILKRELDELKNRYEFDQNKQDDT